MLFYVFTETRAEWLMDECDEDVMRIAAQTTVKVGSIDAFALIYPTAIVWIKQQ